MYLDSIIYNFIYTHCCSLGATFGCGFIEGLCIYIICIFGPTIAILEKRKNK